MIGKKKFIASEMVESRFSTTITGDICPWDINVQKFLRKRFIKKLKPRKDKNISDKNFEMYLNFPYHFTAFSGEEH